MTTGDLTPGDWAVLALISERATHGFAVARLMAPDGEVGRIWTQRRALVYRSVETLTAAGLIAPAGTEASASGPPRRLFEATEEGRARVRAWTTEPVTRIRDARSVLMLKLLFIHRAGRRPGRLLRSQRKVFADRVASLDAQVETAEGFDRTLLQWRIETTAAGQRFCEELLGG